MAAVVLEGSIVPISALSVQLIVLYFAALAVTGTKVDPKITAPDNKALTFNALFIIIPRFLIKLIMCNKFFIII